MAMSNLNAKNPQKPNQKRNQENNPNTMSFSQTWMNGSVYVLK
jgi:hypothetical protein